MATAPARFLPRRTPRGFAQVLSTSQAILPLSPQRDRLRLGKRLEITICAGFSLLHLFPPLSPKKAAQPVGKNSLVKFQIICLLFELSCDPDQDEIRYLVALSTFNYAIYYAVNCGLLQAFSAII